MQAQRKLGSRSNHLVSLGWQQDFSLEAGPWRGRHGPLRGISSSICYLTAIALAALVRCHYALVILAAAQISLAARTALANASILTEAFARFCGAELGNSSVPYNLIALQMTMETVIHRRSGDIQTCHLWHNMSHEQNQGAQGSVFLHDLCEAKHAESPASSERRALGSRPISENFVEALSSTSEPS